MADVLILILTLAMAANGARRGIIKEFIHFVLWFSLGITMAIFTLETVDPAQMDMKDIPKMLQEIGSIFGFAYLMVIVLEKFVIIPVIFKGQKNIPSKLSRITGAIFGAFKMAFVILVATFLHKVYSNTADPELPPFLYNSDVIYYIDGMAIDLYDHVTDQGWLDYEKVVWEQEEYQQENPLNTNPLESILNSTGSLPPNMPKLPGIH